VGVEKLYLPELDEKRIASGCPINDLLGLRIHFDSPISSRFSLESSFSTATPVFANYFGIARHST
jgi:hypothetical protein